jgi:hypothetical protein
MTATAFEIRVRGRVDADSLAEIGDFDVTTAPEVTILTGHAADLVALIGVLTQLRALGLTLLEVRRTPEDLTDEAVD